MSRFFVVLSNVAFSLAVLVLFLIIVNNKASARTRPACAGNPGCQEDIHGDCIYVGANCDAGNPRCGCYQAMPMGVHECACPPDA